MTTYIIVVVNKTKLYPGIDPFIPKPAMGNMLPTTKGYDEKYQEKLDKIQMDLVADPLFAYPTDVTVQFVSVDPTLTTGAKSSYDASELLKAPTLRLHAQQRLEDYVVTGVNPFTDRMLITSYMAKNKAELPYWCKSEVKILDIWGSLTGTHDWRVAAALWNLPKDPIDATVELLKRL